MKRIEEINGILGSGTKTLNESLELYKESLSLLKKCDEALNSAKLEVEQADSEAKDD